MPEERNGGMEIDIVSLLTLLWHKMIWMILSAAAAGAVAFALAEFALTPQYESTTSAYILSKQDGGAVSYSDMQLGAQLTKDYVQLIEGRSVLEKVIGAYGLDETYESFARRVSTRTVTDTRIIMITVKDPDPASARVLADAVREAAAEHIRNVMDIQAVNTADYANYPESPSEPDVAMWALAGAALGFALCGAVVTIGYLLDDTVKAAEDVEEYLGLSVLASIPAEGGQNGRKKRKQKRKH